PNYAVGYGRPPGHSRFKKGRSGNLAGRRRDAQSERASRLLRQEANRMLMLREGDKIEKLPAIRAEMRSLFVSAAKGKTAALKMIAAADPGEGVCTENLVLNPSSDHATVCLLGHQWEFRTPHRHNVVWYCSFCI